MIDRKVFIAIIIFVRIISKAMWKTYWFIVLSKYKLTGPFLGNFNQRPKRCICVFNICTGYVMAVKNVATLVPSPHLRSRCWWLFGRWTAGSSGQSKSFHCCVSFGGGQFFLHEYNIHHLGLRFLCHIWFGILGPLLVGFASSWMSGVLVSSSCHEQMCCGTTRSLIVWLFSSNLCALVTFLKPPSTPGGVCFLPPRTDGSWCYITPRSRLPGGDRIQLSTRRASDAPKPTSSG